MSASDHGRVHHVVTFLDRPDENVYYVIAYHPLRPNYWTVVERCDTSIDAVRVLNRLERTAASE